MILIIEAFRNPKWPSEVSLQTPNPIKNIPDTDNFSKIMETSLKFFKESKQIKKQNENRKRKKF